MALLNPKAGMRLKNPKSREKIMESDKIKIRITRGPGICKNCQEILFHLQAWIKGSLASDVKNEAFCVECGSGLDIII